MLIRALAFTLAGVATWTLLEYVIHRFLGHMRKGKNVIKKEHFRHHAETHYFAPLYKKLILAVLVFAASFSLCGWAFDWVSGACFALGLAGMYFLYEVTHRRFHVREPLLKRYGLRMRKHHFFHHFGNPSVNHGVTTAIWDRLFGTYQRPDQVNIPRSMAMTWLKDRDNQLKSRYQRHFRIR